MVMIEAAAPAKLNLYLHVLGRRDDGYHLLDSLVAFTALGDTLTLRPSDRFSLEIDGPFAAALAGSDPADNLVSRAVRRLAERLGCAPSVAVTLSKQLPVASGIGGGSSDAAATMRGLARLWDLSADDRRLAEVAAGLGADMPVCLRAETSYFAGIGDQLQPAPRLPECGVLLINPGVAVETRAVFGNRRTEESHGAARLTSDPVSAADLARQLRDRHNDLMPAALRLAPQIAAVLAALQAQPDCLFARMSGSGATCLGLFPDEPAAIAAATRLQNQQPGWWVAATRFQQPAGLVQSLT
jgi:4-diphosphocytidyl-2-C-methyl-D-erythritol kinase